MSTRNKGAVKAAILSAVKEVVVVAEKYAYRVVWSEEDQEHVGLCAEFPSLSVLDPSAEKAFAGIRELVRDTLKDMAKAGEELPEPLSLRQYSGKVLVRMPPDLHRKLDMEAHEANVSLNRLVSARLAGM